MDCGLAGARVGGEGAEQKLDRWITANGWGMKCATLFFRPASSHFKPTFLITLRLKYTRHADAGSRFEHAKPLLELPDASKRAGDDAALLALWRRERVDSENIETVQPARKG